MTTGSLRVLVLEDEWMIADQVATALTSAGFDVVGPVGHVKQAFALLANASVDVAVLDINVHGERSFALAEQLAQTGTPFVFPSGYSQSVSRSSFEIVR